MSQQSRCLKYILKLLQGLCKEVFQIKNRGDYFLRNRRDFVIPTVKSVNYGLKSVRFLGPKIWESSPNNLKNKESIVYQKFVLLLGYAFFSQSLIMRYSALNDAPHHRYLTEFWNFGYGLGVKRKESYLYIWKCNNITNNSKKRNSGK